MPTTTPAQALPIPVQADSPDVPRDMSALALAIEKRLVGVYNSASDRDTKTAAAGVQEGMFAFLKDTNAFTFYDGAAWQPAFPTPPAVTSGTTTPSNATGNNGDVYLKV